LHGSKDRTIKVWDSEVGQCINTLIGHSDYVTSMQMYDYGLATASADRTIRMWDIRTGKCHRILEGHSVGVSCLQFDIYKIISGGFDGTVKVWNLVTGTEMHSFNVSSAISDLYFDSSNLLLATEKFVKVYDIEQFSLVRSLIGHTKTISAIKRLEGAILATASHDHTVKLWSM